MAECSDSIAVLMQYFVDLGSITDYRKYDLDKTIYRMHTLFCVCLLLVVLITRNYLHGKYTRKQFATNNNNLTDSLQTKSLDISVSLVGSHSLICIDIPLLLNG